MARPLLLLTALAAGCSEYEVRGKDEVPDPPLDTGTALELVPPVAVAGPTLAVKRGEIAVLDGTASYDPDGDGDPKKLTYAWTPAGELPAFELTDAETPSPGFRADALGAYPFELQVTDVDGLVSENTAYTAVEVIPWEDLTVTLTWTGAGIDLDLHLLAPDGVYYTDSDCFFGNPAPDWGVEGDVSDNPALAEDDDFSGGPEIIRFDHPDEASYRVLVHYFNDHDVANPATQLTVVISAEGAEIGRAEEWLYVEGQVIDLGAIDWPTLGWTYEPTLTTHNVLGGPDVNDPVD